jgi:hypothetical protein
MYYYTIINAISNCTIAFSALALLVHIFGDPDNSIWDNKIKAWFAKFGLSVTTCGAISNVLSLSSPNKTEILLNVGMSITFFWLSWWQWEQFQEIKKAAKKKKTSPGKRNPVATRTTRVKKTV